MKKVELKMPISSNMKNTETKKRKRKKPAATKNQLKKRDKILISDNESEEEIQIVDKMVVFLKKRKIKTQMLDFVKEPYVFDISRLIANEGQILKEEIKNTVYLLPEHHGFTLLEKLCRFIDADKRIDKDFFQNQFSYLNSRIKEYWFCFSCFLIAKKERYLTEQKRIWHHDECKKIDAYVLFTGLTYYLAKQEISKLKIGGVKKFLENKNNQVRKRVMKLLYRRLRVIMTKVLKEKKRNKQIIEDLVSRNLVSYKTRENNIVQLQMNDVKMDIDLNFVFFDNDMYEFQKVRRNLENRIFFELIEKVNVSLLKDKRDANYLLEDIVDIKCKEEFFGDKGEFDGEKIMVLLKWPGLKKNSQSWHPSSVLIAESKTIHLLSNLFFDIMEDYRLAAKFNYRGKKGPKYVKDKLFMIMFLLVFMFSRVVNEDNELLYVEDCESFLKMKVNTQTRRERIEELQEKLKKKKNVETETFNDLFKVLEENDMMNNNPQKGRRRN